MRIGMTVRVLLAVLVMTALPSAAAANPSGWRVIWYDDMSEPTGWTTIDRTAAVPHFHLDSYQAYDDPAFEDDVSWWCGNFDYDADGGYGNSWDDRLVLPSVQIGTSVVEEINWGVIKSLYRDEAVEARERESRPDVMPVLTFVYRHDSEAGYDYTYVEAESLGVWRSLNNGYDGSSGGWQDIGAYGFVLSDYGDPVNVRFRFISDGAYSDEDDLYLSDGGAFQVDNIKIFDFYGGETFFFDDAQSGSPCMPAVPGAAGDYWHLVDDVCSSNVIPSWWCGDDADTSLTPPNLVNSLISPVININGAWTCTVRYAIHAEVPTVDNDYWINSVIVDGFVYNLSAYWGDFEECGGFGTAGLDGDDIDILLPASTLQYMVTFYTTDNGCGPGVAGGAGINLDDTWVMGIAPGRYSSDVAPESLHRMRRRLPTVAETPYGSFR